MRAGKALKRLHKKALRGNRSISLKELSRELSKTGSEDEKLIVDGWHLNKGPTQRQLDKEERRKRKGGLIELQRSATHAAKRKRSSGKNGR